MPQANYFGRYIITLQYESVSDWNFLFNLYGIHGEEIKIRPDYALDKAVKQMIEKLYFDDDYLFDRYCKL